MSQNTTNNQISNPSFKTVDQILLGIFAPKQYNHSNLMEDLEDEIRTLSPAVIIQFMKDAMAEYLEIMTARKHPMSDILSSLLDTDETVNFENEIRQLINKYSKENESNTPDFILASYLYGSLALFNKTLSEREKWNR